MSKIETDEVVFNFLFIFVNDKTHLLKNRIAKENEKVPEVLKAQHLHHENQGMFKWFHDIDTCFYLH